MSQWRVSLGVFWLLFQFAVLPISADLPPLGYQKNSHHYHSLQKTNTEHVIYLEIYFSVLIYSSSVAAQVSHPSSQPFALSESWVWVQTRFCAHDRPAHCHCLVLHCSDLLPVGFQECGVNPVKCNLAGLWLVSFSLWQHESFSHQVWRLQHLTNNDINNQT